MENEPIKNQQAPQQVQGKLSLKWIILGILAVALMWLISSWLY